MANIPVTYGRNAALGNRTMTWADFASGDTLAAVDVGMQSVPLINASVQISGTFSGTTVVLQGSNDDVTYVTLNDVNGNAVSATSDGFFEVSTSALYVKPVATGGTASVLTTIVSVWLDDDYR